MSTLKGRLINDTYKQLLKMGVVLTIKESKVKEKNNG